MRPPLTITLFSCLCSLITVTGGAAAAPTCFPAAAALPASSPIILGNGTPGSVTPLDIQTALDAGGFILFDVGPGPETITLSTELVVTREAVLDGAGVVTLSGANSTRILHITNPSNLIYTLTLQNITLADGATPTGSGAAIYKASGGPWQAVSLNAVHCSFRNNVAIATAQDDGGGAVYATGMRDIRIHDCLFNGNRGSNGGAVYSLGSKTLTVSYSSFTDNRATGTGGNPGNGGNGGAIGVDGADRQVSICATDFLANQSNAFGAGFFTVAYDGTSTTAFDACTFEGNSNPTPNAFAGAAYLQGGPFSIRHSMFRENEANSVGAVFLGPWATGDITNSTFYRNLARLGLAGALSINTSQPVQITNSTFAENMAPGPVAFAAGIRVDAVNAVTLRNTVLSDNTGGNVYNPWNILNPVGDGGGNMQFPMTRPNGQTETAATPTVLWSDPQLMAPGGHGGPTETMALATGSAAIDAGVAAGAPATDQRGAPRTGSIDVGAYEAGILFLDGFEFDFLPWSSTVD